MPYQRHDVNNDDVTPSDLIGRNAYVSRGVTNAPDNPQPGDVVDSNASGDSWKNWNDDYVKRDQNGDDLNPDVPIVIETESQTVGVTADTTRVQETTTGVLATFSGGTAPLTVVGAFYCKPAATAFSDTISDWVQCSTPSSNDNQTYVPQPSEVGKQIAFVTQVTDGAGVTDTSIGDVLTVYSIQVITDQTSYSGIKKVGNTLDIYNATATGGIPPLKYLVQVQFSDSGTTGWSDNVNISGNAAPGEKFTYTIPDEQAGRYMRIRSRVRDNGGVGPYIQVTSTAPDSSLRIADYLSEGSGFGVALNGEFRVGQEITVATIPAFEGGAPTVKYEYQWQKSQDGTNWVGFDSPWTEYDPTTILIDNPSKTLNNSEVGYQIRVQTRATDKTGERLIVSGTVYGPVESEAPAVFSSTGVLAPLGILEGAYRVNETINITPAVYIGGAQPVTRIVNVHSSANGKLTNEVAASFDESDINAGPLTYLVQPIDENKFITVDTVATDAEGNQTHSPIILFTQTTGAVLPYEPAMELVSPTENYGYATVGNILRVRCAEYSGGISPQKYHVLLRISDYSGGNPYEQVTIKANATPGEFYDIPITNDHLNKYLTVVTRVADNDRDLDNGFYQKFSIIPLGYKTITPSTPTPSGPEYDYDGYDFKLYVEPNYKQGHILRVGDTITMTVPEFFGGEAPYRFDLNTWTILDKASAVEVFQSPANQPPGSSVTYTIPPSLQGKYLKVNYYFYDRLLNRFKFEMKLYTGDNPAAETGRIMPAI